MTMLVVDASVAFKWFVAETGSAEARALLGMGAPLEAPELLLAEVANAVWKMERRGCVMTRQATAILPALR